MSKNKKSGLFAGTFGPILIVVAALSVLIGLLLRGNNVALFNAKGWIADQQAGLIVIAVIVLLLIAVPTLSILYFTAWKYRESNTKAKRDPKVGHGKLLNVSMWFIPAVFAAFLAFVMIPATHKLEPQKNIDRSTKPMTIQVVALRWKWLFIYPDQKIATVNYVQIPVGTPVTFELTADETPMSAFWIPNLGGMLYAMTGHVNSLNLIADVPGEYPGGTAEINGAGFGGMRFIAHATSKSEFDSWAKYGATSADALDSEKYKELLKPSENNDEAYYSLPNSDLYAKVLMKYAGGHQHHPAQHEGAHH